MIKKTHGHYKLVSHTGKNLGTFSSKAEAIRREKQVTFFKNLDAGKIPSRVVKKKSLLK